MKTKKSVRLRRAARTRRKIGELRVPRLCVNRTPRHIYAQLIDSNGATLAAVSTVQSTVSAVCKYNGNVDAAKVVGTQIAEKIVAAGIKKVAFDRSGFKFHGRIKALAEAARQAGLEF